MGRFHVVLGMIFVPCCFFVLLTDTSMEVAHGKPTKAEKLYDKRSYWDADKVVDGNINTNVYCNSCLHTKPNGAAKAWWRVDLEEQHAIDRVEIYNAEPHEPKKCDNGIKQNVASTVARQENDRLKGYSIYVSTKKKVPSGEPCYKDPSGSGQYPDLYQDNSCEGVGRYVSIYNDHKATVGPLYGAALVLCEVKVYGCPIGSFGENCSRSCSSCKGTDCNPTTGVCKNGCVDGRRGLKCDEDCPEGYYGAECKFKCGGCKNISDCDARNGECTSGCSPGYNGSYCEECPNGTFGENCIYKCGKCREAAVCRKEDGVCPNGCQDGYQIPKCQKECPNGTFGENCIYKCGKCREAAVCRKEDGVCPNGCQDGYQIPKCQKECDDGKYGTNCSLDCGKCKDGKTCDKANGHCQDGCQRGYMFEPPTCDVECDDGKYGTNCSLDCGKCGDNKTCDKANGHCQDGCQRGYMFEPPTCDKECPNGTFGDNCNNTCGKCRESAECRKEDGICPNGCQDGYYDLRCTKECEDGKYGTNCSLDCGQCRGDKTCDKANGHCQDGCQRGYMFEPPTCDVECPDGKYGNNCSHDCGKCANDAVCIKSNGTCPSGCQDGYWNNRCKFVCPAGKYGKDCALGCGKCSNTKKCNNVDGACPNRTCEDGYKPPTCHEGCDDGQYGTNCSMDCGECRNNDTSNKGNGYCPNSCQDGYKPPLCIEECDDGQYGTNCSMDCGNCRNADTCYKGNGHCPNSCQDGYKPPTCSEVCDPFWYGEDCTQACGKCRNGEACDSVTGTCATGCTDGWMGEFCNQERLQENEESNFSSVSVVGIVIGLVALMIAVVLVLLFVRRRKQQRAGPFKDAGIKINVEDTSNFGDAKPKNRRDGAVRNDNKRDGTSDEAQPMMELTNGDAHTSNGISDQHYEKFRVDSMYINTMSSRTAVGITEIRDMIKTKINEDIFDEEYKRLPKGLFYPAEISKYPGNKKKNRYITTLPYDCSIVPLSPLTGKQYTDYINANYIDGVTIPKTYIATQGPLPHTVGDFWRMVWETQSERIVMLTKLQEGEKKKCHQYWPSAPGESISAAYLNVQSKLEKMYSAFTIRDFTITNTKTHSTREITQFHFTAWPDHSTPDVLDLVMFQHQVSMKVKSLRGPDVVHCSAGIGRTGTYIGLDALLQYGCTNRNVDIYSYVEAMDKNRLNMVQTKDQYICLHNALAEGFVLNKAFLSSQKFDKILRESEQETTPNNKIHTCTEFRTLHSVRPIVDDKSKMEANKGENRNKNRDKNIIPVSKYKPYLMTQGCYINAVLLPSLTVSPGFIATQYPLPNTLNDFWSLVYDQESSVIVLLEPDIESVMADLSANQESVYGKLSVHFKKSQTTFNGIQQINVSLFREGNTESSHVVILTPSHWPWREIMPQSPDVLVSLIQMTRRLRKTSEDGPVIVMCCNGSTKCGLFCALCNIAEILHETGEVTVQYVARQLQIRRPEFILDMEQYNYIYTIIGKLMEEESIYVNS